MNQKEIFIACVAVLGMYVYYNKQDTTKPVDPHIIPDEEKRPYDIDRSFCDDKCDIKYIQKKSMRQQIEF
jgi:hypothetical protein